MKISANETETAIISRKKPAYPITKGLRHYLRHYKREVPIPCRYEDLRRYHFAMPLLDQQGCDTLWETVYYSDTDRDEIHLALTTIYAILKAAGDTSVMKHKFVDRIDYCTFGNSNPFRVRIVNKFNDNYDYFYVKTADASRIYGLELEHILSPNRINYIAFDQTLIEEHIAGIPGDRFMAEYLTKPPINETRIAKEFIKFNERCLVKLLGDMRAYNFVIDITPDFDDIQYRIRAIDFDQQCYESRKNLYLPQYFKENLPLVNLCIKRITPESVRQYQHEERALMAHRLISSKAQVKELLGAMTHEILSTNEKTAQLRSELAQHYENTAFERCQTMGEIVKTSLWTVLLGK